jgi:hypothetical protein
MSLEERRNARDPVPKKKNKILGDQDGRIGNSDFREIIFNLVRFRRGFGGGSGSGRRGGIG